MSNNHTTFWLALMELRRDREQRARLWNGYVGWKLPPWLRGASPRSGWPQYVVDPPPGGWPELSDDEKSLVEDLAEAHGGHPSWGERPFMNFSGSRFGSEVNLSDLTLVDADFGKAHFKGEVTLEASRFFMQSWFGEATFEGGAHFHKTFFEAVAHFDRVQFRSYAGFISVEFNGGATFAGAGFRAAGTIRRFQIRRELFLERGDAIASGRFQGNRLSRWSFTPQRGVWRRSYSIREAPPTTTIGRLQ